MRMVPITVHSGQTGLNCAEARQSGVCAVFVIDQSTAVESGPIAMAICLNFKALFNKNIFFISKKNAVLDFVCFQFFTFCL